MKRIFIYTLFLGISLLGLAIVAESQNSSCDLTINDNNPGTTYSVTIYVLDCSINPPSVLHTEYGFGNPNTTTNIPIYYSVPRDITERIFRLYAVVIRDGTTQRNGYSNLMNTEEYDAGYIPVTVDF